MDAYCTQSPDTSRDADEFLFQAYRRMKPWEKIRIMDDLNRMSDGLARLGIRERHPEATEEEVDLRLGALKYGREVMVRFFGWDPDVRGW